MVLWASLEDHWDLEAHCLELEVGGGSQPGDEGLEMCCAAGGALDSLLLRGLGPQRWSNCRLLQKGLRFLNWELGWWWSRYDDVELSSARAEWYARCELWQRLNLA